MRATKPSELRDPQDALRAYLDEMLHLATSARVAETAAGPAPRRGVSESPAPAAVASPPPPGETGTAVESGSGPAVTIAAVPEVAAGGRPEIASAADRFGFPLQCLMFRVGGQLLGLPLLELAGVIRAETRPTRLPKMPAEMLGLLQHREQTLRIVDSGALLGIAAAGKAEGGHLLLLAAGDWALTCDAPEKVVYLGRDEVQWRTGDAGGVRYGTIRESLAPLLAAEAICRRLEGLGT